MMTNVTQRRDVLGVDAGSLVVRLKLCCGLSAGYSIQKEYITATRNIYDYGGVRMQEIRTEERTQT